MTQESKRTAIATLHTAAGRVVKPSRYRRQRNYSGCCAAMAGTTPWEVYLAFESTFKPAHDPAYWWPKPSSKNKGRASNGKTYKPSDARCLALLLMAEMVRTGDV